MTDLNQVQYKITEEEWQAMYSYISICYGSGMPFSVTSQKVDLRENVSHLPDTNKEFPHTRKTISTANITITGCFNESKKVYTCKFRKFFGETNVVKYSILGKFNISVIGIKED